MDGVSAEVMNTLFFWTMVLVHVELKNTIITVQIVWELHKVVEADIQAKKDEEINDYYIQQGIDDDKERRS